MSILSKKIDEHLEKDYSQFHSPAHAGRLNQRDLTELDGLDDLQKPTEVLKESLEKIARLFGARQSFFLTNGASLGMQAACLALKIYLNKNSLTKPVLVTRNVHKSTVAGIILAGLDIEWFEPEWDSELGVYARFYLESSRVREFESSRAFELSNFRTFEPNHYSAIIVTNPTYEGFHSSLPKLSIPVIVDEAHGAHYHFSPALPKPALESGADIVIQSWHKTLGSLTQTGVMHLGQYSKIPARYLENALRLIQSTSPSYLLLESICKVAEMYEKRGFDIMNDTLSLARKIPSEYLVKNDDPTRLIIKGKDLERRLEEQQIIIEHSNSNYALAVMNPGNSIKDAHRLQEALKEIKPEPNINGVEKPIFNQESTDIRATYLNSDGELNAPCPPGIVM